MSGRQEHPHQLHQPAGRPGPRPAGPMGMMGGPMGMPVAKAKNFKGTLKRLLGYLKPHRHALIAVFALAILGNVFTILAPKILGEATTTIFAGVAARMKGIPGAAIDFAAIGRMIALLILLYVCSSVFSYVQQYVMTGIAQRTVYELRRQVNSKLSRLPLRFFDSRPHGETLSRITNDVDNISNTLQQGLTQLIASLVTLVGVVVMMLTISPLLTLICILTLPLSAVVTARIAKRSQGYFIGQQRSLGELNGHVEEMFGGHAIVKAFGHEQKSVQTFREINARLYEAGWRAQFVSGIIMPLMSFIGNLGYLLICVVGGILVAGQRLAIGDVQAFIQYTRQFSMPIMQAANFANLIQSTVASAERVFELLDEPEEEPDAEEPAVFDPPRGSVSFHQVRFGYRDDTPLLDGLNIDVQPGQMVAIVGPTGAGKTTLVNLLMRFYELNGGSITIDGRNIREWPRGKLRSLFGMVLQDTWLFHGTIRENIAYGRLDATEEEIVQAAVAAHADHFIRTLPDGYDTILNEEASNISQGQKQLLTIARAFLANPAILILDEATSNVDTRTEIQIQHALSRLMEGRTCFVIAHRLSTIRNADRILVMNKGRIVEQGTHEELLAAGGFYADLYHSQFGQSVAKKAM